VNKVNKVAFLQEICFPFFYNPPSFSVVLAITTDGLKWIDFSGLKKVRACSCLLLGEFNVSLLRGAPNPRAVFSSKAVGEPPLFLASSVFFAVKASSLGHPWDSVFLKMVAVAADGTGFNP
jgi:hypothetical protein